MKNYKCPKCGMKYKKPGKCSMDGAKLVKNKNTEDNNTSHKSHDHTEHHKHMIKDFKKRFIVSAIVTFPIIILSPLIQNLLGLSIDFRGEKYVLWILSTFIFFYGGWPFLKGIFEELRKKQPGMMTLIALAIFVAFVYSSAVVFGLEGKLFFLELATLIDIMLLGHWLEMKSVIGASKALEKLAELLPDTAHLKENGDIKKIKISELKKDDIVLIKAGEKIPADGVIVKGETHINESMLTGESKPVKKSKNDEVIGGSINGDGVLEVKIKNIADDSYLNKVIDLVKKAQQSKSKTQRLADTAAKWLTIIAIATGVVTFVYWIIFGPDLAFAIERMATVMVITCPHALGLAIPLVTAVSTSLSAKNGLLIRNRTAFENSRKITNIVFDKTGTLTKAEFGVKSIKIFNDDYNEKKIIQLAAALEKNSEHPIAKGIRAELDKHETDALEVSDFQILKGKGVKGKIDNKTIKLVSEKYLSSKNINIPESNETGTLVYVLIDNEPVGLIILADKIRKDSAEAVKQLQKSGIKCWMLTGDNEKIAENVSTELGLDGFFAEVLPHEKQEKIKELQDNGEFVAMAGDGVNDAPSLAQADIGIAVGSGTDVAAETADIILVDSNPKDINSLILFGKATYSKMIQNLFWATGYNVIAIPLAAGVLYSFGFVISPALGAALMSLSTVIVAINAKFLKVKKA
ncbi:MAG: cadmium-translocating P-type ATPase [Candidatus Magasanikbacteria bacterium]|nr:cadmium-translocating P-type ATPase [Candidatus Magasanikbacteria bacterium]